MSSDLAYVLMNAFYRCNIANTEVTIKCEVLQVDKKPNSYMTCGTDSCVKVTGLPELRSYVSFSSHGNLLLLLDDFLVCVVYGACVSDLYNCCRNNWLFKNICVTY